MVLTTLQLFNFTATGGDGGPYHCAKASGSIPPGLTLSANCFFAGVPISLGFYHFVVNITDPTAPTYAPALLPCNITVVT